MFAVQQSSCVSLKRVVWHPPPAEMSSKLESDAQAAANSSELEAGQKRVAELQDEKENVSASIAQLNQQKEQLAESTKTFEVQMSEITSGIEQLETKKMADVPRIK